MNDLRTRQRRNLGSFSVTYLLQKAVEPEESISFSFYLLFFKKCATIQKSRKILLLNSTGVLLQTSPSNNNNKENDSFRVAPSGGGRLHSGCTRGAMALSSRAFIVNNHGDLAHSISRDKLFILNCLPVE